MWWPDHISACGSRGLRLQMANAAKRKRPHTEAPIAPPPKCSRPTCPYRCQVGESYCCMRCEYRAPNSKKKHDSSCTRDRMDNSSSSARQPLPKLFTSRVGDIPVGELLRAPCLPVNSKPSMTGTCQSSMREALKQVRAHIEGYE